MSALNSIHKHLCHGMSAAVAPATRLRSGVQKWSSKKKKGQSKALFNAAPLFFLKLENNIYLLL